MFEDVLSFSWRMETANLRPKGVWEVFAMSDAEFHRYRVQSVDKAWNVFNDNGIGVFEAQHVRGLIRFGRLAKPEEISAEVFSNEKPTSQGILVSSASLEESRIRLITLLAAFRYTANVPDDDAELERLIRRDLEKDSRFVTAAD